jgi:hypothetical protein
MPLDKSVMDVMDSIVEPKDEVMHRSCFPDSEPMSQYDESWPFSTLVMFFEIFH